MKQNYLNENIERIVGIVCTIFVSVFVFALFSFIPVKADYLPDYESSYLDDDFYSYSLNYSATTDNPQNTSYYWFCIAQLRSNHQMFLYHSGTTDYEKNGYRYYQVGYVDSDGVCTKFSNYSQPIVCKSYVSNTYSKSDSKLVRDDIYGMNEAPAGTVSSFQVYYDPDYETDGYVFENLESAQEYFDTGYTDGLIREPDGSVDFTPDTEKATYSNFHLVGFNATSSISATWEGLDVKHQKFDLETGDYTGTPTDYKNAFIEFEFGISSLNDPGYTQKIYTYPSYVAVSFKKMNFDASKIINSSNYLLYVKATPYHYVNDNIEGKLYRGSASYIYFDAKGNPSRKDVIDESIGGGNRRGTVNLHDFYLDNVRLKDGFLSQYNEEVSAALAFGKKTIFWNGTTKDSDLAYIPDDDTLVTVTEIVTCSNGEYKPITLATKTINLFGTSWPKVQIDTQKLFNDANANSYYWDGEIWLVPSYTKDGVLYMGMPTIVNVLDGSVERYSQNEDGSGDTEDVTPDSGNNKDDSIGITSPTSILSLFKGLLGGMSSLVSQFGQFGSFLAAAFVFVPSYIWNIIGTGLTISIITMVIKAFL